MESIRRDVLNCSNGLPAHDLVPVLEREIF
jgi:hypothetical protein